MRVLVLGAYGLIGREIVRELRRRDMTVVGLGRSAELGRRLIPDADWIGRDIASLTKPDSWSDVLRDIDAVVNASGALQTGGRDNLTAVQRDAIGALIRACEQAGISAFVQISAPGAEPGVATEFLSTKGEADKALRASGLGWVILKPGLVISSTAYGGTSLLRVLAAVPLIQPIVLGDARLQTIGVHDVARAVVRSLSDPGLARQEFDLVEPSAHTLHSVVLAFRRWLGFPPPAMTMPFPAGLGLMIGGLADLAGRLGWRSPLRSTALRVISSDVLGDPEPWRRATGETFNGLPETLADLPSTRQERLFARTQLVFPVLVVAFALFWIVSGLIGLARIEGAAAVISARVGEPLATSFVYVGSILDLLIGCALLVRRTFRPGCLAAIALSLGYLAAGTLITPHLWADPLGPFVKVVPVIGLALVLATMAEER